jgi:hypothetical protein
LGGDPNVRIGHSTRVIPALPTRKVSTSPSTAAVGGLSFCEYTIEAATSHTTIPASHGRRPITNAQTRGTATSHF